MTDLHENTPSRPYRSRRRNFSSNMVPLQVRCPAAVAHELRRISRYNLMDMTQITMMAIKLVLERRKMAPAPAPIWGVEAEEVLEAAESDQSLD